MKKIAIEIGCCLCSDKISTSIYLPEGWDHEYEEVDVENAFCPKHSLVKEWSDNQCSGCVGGWGDCSLWKSFAYSRSKMLTDEELESVRRGICPKRTNGTFSFSKDEGFKDLDWSEQAPTKSGEAFAQAILEYRKLFEKDRN